MVATRGPQIDQCCSIQFSVSHLGLAALRPAECLFQQGVTKAMS